MSRLKWNVLANLAGGMWTSLLGIVFIPLYLKYLGIEAYGLIGFFATLQAVFGVLDFGLGLTLTRGMARLSVHGAASSEQRDLLRTVEIIYWSIAIVTGTALVLLAGPIAARWVQSEHLTPATVAGAVRLMGVIGALQFPFALYKAGLSGLQRQVLVNVISVIIGTLRSAGVVAVLAYVSRTVEAFFISQAVLAAVQVAVTFAAMWWSVPGPSRPQFRLPLIRREWRYAVGVSGNAVIGIFLTQSDKVVLSGILPLADFGYYALAGTAAGALWWLVTPVNTALFPRFAQLVETGDQNGLRELYHSACQAVAAIIVPAAVTFVFFAYHVLLLWTRDAVAARHASLVAAILVAGTCINGLASVSAYLQSAAGWPQLTMYTNMVAAVVLVPLIILLAGRFGGPGAAAVWLLVNLSYVTVTIPLMHRRLLRGELSRWYLEDVLLPLIAVVTVLGLARAAMPASLPPIALAAWIASSGIAATVAAVLVLPRVRRLILQNLTVRAAVTRTP